MSDLEKKAADYAEKVKNYQNLHFNPDEVGRYHSLSEQQFDNYVGQLEDALQEDIKKMPDILIAFDKILQPLKRVKK